MARELKELRASASGGAGGGASGGLGGAEHASRLSEQLEAVHAALGIGDFARGGEGGGGAAEALRTARAQRDEAEAAKEALRVEMRAELTAAVEAKEAALSQLAAHKAGHDPEQHGLKAELDAAAGEVQREREAHERTRRELDAANAAREKLLVQARLDGAALASREREYSQQLNAKEVQVSALERELATMAGQLVSSQAESRGLQQAGSAGEDHTRRERATMLQAQEALERDKLALTQQLKVSEERAGELVETIKALKQQLEQMRTAE